MISTGYIRQLMAELERQDGAWWGRPGPTYDGKLGPWNTLKLNGKVFPGADDTNDPRACAVRVHGRVRFKTDIQRSMSSGQKIMSIGYHPEPITLVAKFWRQEQWVAFKSLLPTIHPKMETLRLEGRRQTSAALEKVETKQEKEDRDKRRSYFVEHPVLNAYQINQIYIEDIEMPEDGEHRMIQTVRIQVLEVFDIKKDEPKHISQTTVGRRQINDDTSIGLAKGFEGVGGEVFDTKPRRM